MTQRKPPKWGAENSQPVEARAVAKIIGLPAQCQIEMQRQILEEIERVAFILSPEQGERTQQVSDSRTVPTF